MARPRIALQARAQSGVLSDGFQISGSPQQVLPPPRIGADRDLARADDERTNACVALAHDVLTGLVVLLDGRVRDRVWDA